MAQAITTKFHCPTNHSGSRISAHCDAGRLVLPWDHALNPDGNHAMAVRALLAKLTWSGRWVQGHTHDGTSVWVDANSVKRGAGLVVRR